MDSGVLIEISSDETNEVNEDKQIDENREIALKILAGKTAFAFEGGGVLGIAHVGALVRLYEIGGLRNIEAVAGTSVGSLIALALSCGASIDYIEQTLFELDLEDFKDGGNWFYRLTRLIFRYGLHKGDIIEEFAGKILKDLTGNSNLTFGEAHQRFNNHLTITYLSTRYSQTMYADYVTEPDLEIKKAARWSSTIPYFYKGSRRYNQPNRLNKYQKQLIDVIVDGGVGDNYPIHVLREQNFSPENILGFKLYNTNEPNRYKGSPIPLVDHGIPSNLIDYSFRLVEFLRAQALRYHVDDDDWKLTCKIDVGEFKTTDFDITEKDRLWLYNSGKEAMDKYIDELIFIHNNN